MVILIWRFDDWSQTTQVKSPPILFEEDTGAVLEITVGHWPFSNQFEHLADQNLF